MRAVHQRSCHRVRSGALHGGWGLQARLGQRRGQDGPQHVVWGLPPLRVSQLRRRRGACNDYYSRFGMLIGAR